MECSYCGRKIGHAITCQRLLDQTDSEVRRAVPKFEEKYSEESKVPDLINHPSHYTSGGIETIDFIEAKQLNYNLGNVIKYVTRFGKKEVGKLRSDEIRDLEKAAWYLNREIQNLKKA